MVEGPTIPLSPTLGRATPEYRLVSELRKAWVRAGSPSSHEIKRGIDRKYGKGDVARISHVSICHLLGGQRVQRWEKVRSVVVQIGGNPDEFWELWAGTRPELTEAQKSATPVPVFTDQVGPEPSDDCPAAEDFSPVLGPVDSDVRRFYLHGALPDRNERVASPDELKHLTREHSIRHDSLDERKTRRLLGAEQDWCPRCGREWVSGERSCSSCGFGAANEVIPSPRAAPAQEAEASKRPESDFPWSLRQPRELAFKSIADDLHISAHLVAKRARELGIDEAELSWTAIRDLRRSMTRRATLVGRPVSARDHERF